jgi:hypothetical protein
VAAETRLADVERQLAELKASSSKTEEPMKQPEPPAPPPQEPEPEPDLEAYESGDKAVDGEAYAKTMQRFLKDHRAWEKRQDQLEAERKQQTESAKAAETSKAKRWEDQSATVRAEHPDYDETIAQPLYTPSMQFALRHYPGNLGARLAYWLGKHPDEANRVAALHLSQDKTRLADGLEPAEAVAICQVEFARIASQLEAPQKVEPPAAKSAPPAPKPEAEKPSAPTKSKISEAPEPIEPVGSGAAPASGKDPNSMGAGEYNRWLQTPEGQAWYHSQRR